MAIAFDNATAFTSAIATSVTLAHTVTGSSPAILSGVLCAANDITGCTYNGVAMTLLDNLGLVGDAGGWTNLALFYLLNPATGANNLVASHTGGASIAVRGLSYTGVRQVASAIDTHGTTGPVSGVTTMSPTLTVAGGGAWLISWARNDQAAFTAGAGTTLRGANSSIQFADSNAIVAVGSQSLVVNWVGAGNGGACNVVLLPPASNSMLALF